MYGEEENKNQVRVPIEEKKGPISRLKRISLRYPKTWQALKWSLFGVGLASVIFLTGGVAALPFVGAFVTAMGGWGILLFAPIVSASVAFLWYGALKPLLQWSTNPFFYPQFHLREIHPIDDPDFPGSSAFLVDALGVKQMPQQPQVVKPEYISLKDLGKKKQDLRVENPLEISNSIINSP